MVSGVKFAKAVAILAVVTAVSAIAWLCLGSGVGFDVTRLRNALIYEVRGPSAYDWAPTAVPPGFLRGEGARAPSAIRAALPKIFSKLGPDAGDFAKILAIVRYLDRVPHPSGRPIRSNTERAYRLITKNGEGYCADYTQVLNGLALAAGIPIRQWGMSFDGFGSDGHAFSEIYDRALKKWVFIDSFYSFYVTDREGTPLSVKEFRSKLRNHGTKSVRAIPIKPWGYRFPSAAYALRYYYRGIDSFFMIWGNDVFSYDANPVVKTTSALSRAAEQGVAILLGIYPRMVIQRTRGDAAAIAELAAIRRILFILLAAGVVGFCAAGYLVVARTRGRRG